MSDQLTRAALMDRVGAASTIIPTELTPQLLAQKLRIALNAPTPTAKLALDGAQRAAALLVSIANRGDNH
jgi:predicted glycosyltransferase